MFTGEGMLCVMTFHLGLVLSTGDSKLIEPPSRSAMASFQKKHLRTINMCLISEKVVKIQSPKEENHKKKV